MPRRNPGEGVTPHANLCRQPARPEEVNARHTCGPHAREPVILSARHITLPDLLRHIEAGHIVLVLPTPADPR